MLFFLMDKPLARYSSSRLKRFQAFDIEICLEISPSAIKYVRIICGGGFAFGIMSLARRCSVRLWTYICARSGLFRKISFTSSIFDRNTRQLFSACCNRSFRVGLSAAAKSSQEPLYSISFGRQPNGTSLFHLQKPSTSSVWFLSVS